MQRVKSAGTFTFAAMAALALSLASPVRADDKGCINASLKGTFSFIGTGVIVSPDQLAGPVAEVGTQTFDGRGGTTYTATLSQNGNIIPVTATGTYVVNPDCTGTMTVLVAQFQATIHLSFAINDSGWGFHAIETETGFVVTRVGRKLFLPTDARSFRD